MHRRGSSRLLSLGVLLVVVGLGLSGVAVAETSTSPRPTSVLAPVTLGLLAFSAGVLAGRR